MLENKYENETTGDDMFLMKLGNRMSFITIYNQFIDPLCFERIPTPYKLYFKSILYSISLSIPIT